MVSSQINERFDYAFTQPDTLIYSATTFFKVGLIFVSIKIKTTATTAPSL